MTTFAQLQDGVFNETKRPDLVTETANAIRRATLKFHTADKWLRDLVNAIVPLTPLYSGDPRFQIDLTTAPFVRFRDINSVKEYVNPPGCSFIQFSRREVDDLLDYQYGIEDTNYYYRAGNTLNLRCQNLITNASVWYYQFPVTSADVSYSSWIADVMPDAIIQEACIALFNMIGKESSARVYQNFFNENLALLRQFGIVSGD